MGQFGIGQSVRREEDPRLLQGRGNYVNDVNLPLQTHCYIFRSPHAHAEITHINTSVAANAPGVVDIFIGDDVAADNLGTPGMVAKRKRPDGSDMWAPPQTPLALGRVRYVGDPIAMVIAETLDQAKNAAELIEIKFDTLASVTDTADTVEPDSPPVWEQCPDNISNVFEIGDAETTENLIQSASKIVKRRFVITRVHAQFIEPRGALGEYNERNNRYTLYADVQYPHRVRQVLAEKIFRIPEQSIRVVAADVGGGFGAKAWQYVEHRLVLWASKKIGRPVKWTCERSESILADEHGRDNVTDAELALDADNNFLALRVSTLANVGAYISSIRNLLSTFSNVGTLVGVYRFQAAHSKVLCVLSNTNPTAPYRGAGRPEASYVIERLIDEAAKEFGIDAAELRQRNIVTSNETPYKTALMFTYDCGEFDKNMNTALEISNYHKFTERRSKSDLRGKLRGIGIANAIERAASPGPDFAEIRFSTDGTTTILMGTKNQGQGHETMYKQIAGESLGLDSDDIRVVDGDTDQVAFGMGTMGSRSMVIGGSALYIAANKIITKGKKLAAHLLEAGEDDLEFQDGSFTILGTDKSISLKEVAKASFLPAKIPYGLEPGLFETGSFSPERDTFPNGCHVAEVEIDPETGQVDIVDYSMVDDVGNIINPMTLKGQIHGGVTQGVGQILMEQVAYEPESGQLLSGSFMDYAMPRADTMGFINIKSNIVPTTLNPLGVKGGGEAGTVGAMPALMNAIMNALSLVGVEHLDMPASPDRIWGAIQKAKKAA